MKQATFTEIRNHAKKYFDLVESGEAVRVLRNGQPIADIVPIMADLPSADLFVSTDKRQCDAAAHAGLRVEVV
jgi:antitoxin (DNA-binding transcriptional repressor) of toxin-antitoxin stability system